MEIIKQHTYLGIQTSIYPHLKRVPFCQANTLCVLVSISIQERSLLMYRCSTIAWK